MATSRSNSAHGALPALLMAVVAVVTMAMSARTCAGVSTGGCTVTVPPIQIVNLTISNQLTQTINFTFSSQILVACSVSASTVIASNASGKLPVKVTGATGVGTTVSIIVGGKDVYEISGGSLISGVLAQTGTVVIKVSSPCPKNQTGIYLTSSSTLLTGLVPDSAVCVGPLPSS